MNRTVLLTLLLLSLTVVVLWFLVYHFEIVPPHSRDPAAYTVPLRQE